MTSLIVVLKGLRDILRAMPPTGDNGFEGLLATIVAANAGLQIRLAKSGSQFGRDASSPTGAFAVAVEAKRYGSNLRLEALAGKVALAGYSMGRDTDLWILGATTEVGDDIVRKLPEIADAEGMSVLFLDWSRRPLPALAVFLAAAKSTTLDWFATHHPSADNQILDSSLSAIAGDTSFSGQWQSLKLSLSAAHNGLGTLKQRNADWIRSIFSERLLSRQTLGQIITPLDLSNTFLSRKNATAGLAKNVLLRSGPAVIAILGEEGVGKTWLTASLWLDSEQPPILIPVSGRRVDYLDPMRPLPTIAALLALDYADFGHATTDSWVRRLTRWSERERPSDGSPRFAMVLDGLNERSDIPWADNIISLGKTLFNLGGILVITSRPSFWQRDVAPRLSPDIERVELTLEGYTSDEVDTLLKQSGKEPSSLSPQLKTFLRNPRVCNVAVHLLDSLALAPNQLTVERLLLEYWQQRLTERGNLLRHNVQDFHNLLKAHAKDWLSQPHRTFNLDEWSTRSGLAKRDPSAKIVNDLSDIVDGQFMRSLASQDGMYEFRPEGLAFALGLLILQELKSGETANHNSPRETIDGILEPIRGFDLTSDIVIATFGLACLDETLSSDVLEAILRTWASLQNARAGSADSLSAYLTTHPNTFLDVLAHLHTDKEYSPQENSLVYLILSLCQHPRVRSALAERLPGWLGRWCRKGVRFSDTHKPNEERTAVVASLRGLHSEEQKTFTALCQEMLEPEEIRIDDLAAAFMAAGPQAPIAEGIWAWSLAQSLAPDHSRSVDDLAWAIRLNLFDFIETQCAVRKAIAAVSAESSTSVREAAAIALRLLGSTDSAIAANELSSPVSAGQRMRRVAGFCDTNPHDPEAALCTNLKNAVQLVTSLDPDKIRRGRFATKEDHDLDLILPALARFDPEPLIQTIRHLIQSIGQRVGMRLRALAWELPEYSALMNSTSVSAIKDAFTRFSSEACDWSDTDNQLVMNQMLRALFPHLNAREQLELLLRVPPGVLEFLTLRQSLKMLASEELEAALENAHSESNLRAIERILFFASATKHDFTPRTREIVVAQLSSGRDRLTNVACDLIRRSEDRELNQCLLEHAVTLPPILGSQRELFWRSQAIAHVVTSERRPDLLWTVDPDLRGSVAAQLGGETLREVTSQTEAAILRLLQPIVTLQLPYPPVMVEATPNGLKQMISIPEDDRKGDLRALFSDLSNPEAAAKSYGARQKDRLAGYQRLLEELSAEGARAALEVPVSSCIQQIVKYDTGRVRGWLKWILATERSNLLSQVFNIGTNLAAAFASVDGSLAASVLRHLAPHQSFFRIVIGAERVPLFYSAVFAESSATEMSALRDYTLAAAFNDAEIETCVIAARTSGSKRWIDSYIERHRQDPCPSLCARALTVAGFCYPDNESPHIMTTTRPSGFLHDVAMYSMKNRTRAAWAQHWCIAALAATKAEDLWCYGKLAEGVVDLRFARCFEEAPNTELLRQFGSELYERLLKAAEGRSKKRMDTLFGLKAPRDGMRSALEWASRNRPQLLAPETAEGCV
jgi:hypothetical protein